MSLALAGHPISEGVKGAASLKMIIGEPDSKGSIEANLLGGLLDKFFIIESCSGVFPTAEISFADRGGVVVDNIDRLYVGPIIYQFGYPDTSIVAHRQSHRHAMFAIRKAELTSVVDTDSLLLDLLTRSEISERLTVEDPVRSFGAVSASAAARLAVEADGVAIRKVEEGSDKRVYIQAQWTTVQFLRHLAQRHVSSAYGAKGAVFFFDRKDELTFGSPKWLLESGKASAVPLTFSTNPTFLAEDPSAILAWSFSSSGRLYPDRYGIGQTFKYYDAVNYAYAEVLKRLGQIKADFETSAATAVKRLNVSRSRYIGSVVTADDLLMDSKSLSTLVDLQVLIQFSDQIRLGDVVDVTIPINERANRVRTIGRGTSPVAQILESLSSYWLVSKITHFVDHGSRHYLMKLVLTRSGFGIKEPVAGLL